MTRTSVLDDGNVIDDTWTFIVLIDPATEGTLRPLYWRHTTNGGKVEDPIYAHLLRSADASLHNVIEMARKDNQGALTWEPRRMIVRVEPFHRPQDIDRLMREDLRRRALAKLNPAEQEALGLLREEL